MVEEIHFSGTRADNGALPSWWVRYADVPESAQQDGLASIVRDLPRAMETEVKWVHPGSGEPISTEKHNALVDPDRALGVQPDDPVEDTDEALWFIPTDDYEIINPAQFLDGCVDAIEAHDLGDQTFGRFELRKNGGDVRGDIYFDSQQIDLPWRDGDPVMLGFEVGWDFFGGTPAYAEGVGMDTGCTNSMRKLTDREIVRHQGDVESRIDFWNDLLDNINLVADELTQAILEADDITADFHELPFDMEQFYEYLGYPEYLAEEAARDVRAQAADPFEPTMWELHRGATYAVSHHFRGDGTGSAIDRYNRQANDILFNPPQTLERVESNHRQEMEGQDTLGDAGAGEAAIADFRGRVEEKRDAFENREERIREQFTRTSGD